MSEGLLIYAIIGVFLHVVNIRLMVMNKREIGSVSSQIVRGIWWAILWPWIIYNFPSKDSQ